MKWVGSTFIPPPPSILDGKLLHQEINPPRISIQPPWKITGIHLSSLVERGIVKVQCCAQKYNIQWPGQALNPDLLTQSPAHIITKKTHMAYKGTVTVCGVLDFCVYLQTKIRICFFQWNLFYCILSSIKFVFHLKRKKQKVTSVLSFILNNCPRSMMIKTFTYSQSYD